MNRGVVWQVENTLTYTKEFGKHNVTAMLGQSALESTGKNLNGSRMYLMDEDPDRANLGFATDTREDRDAGGTPYAVRAYNTDQYISAYTGREIDAGIAKANEALLRSGGTMTGALVLHDVPAEEMDAVPKKYVDSEISTANTKTNALVNSSLKTAKKYAEEYVAEAISKIELTPGPKGDAGVGIIDITITEVV